MNPNITFSSSNTAGENLDIVLPCAAFDLTASFPVANNTTTNYFPLRRAANDTQYALGRVFLQEAYVTLVANPGGNVSDGETGV